MFYSKLEPTLSEAEASDLMDTFMNAVYPLPSECDRNIEVFLRLTSYTILTNPYSFVLHASELSESLNKFWYY